MLKLTIERKWKKSTYTVGAFFVGRKRFYETLEDKDRGLKSTMSHQKIKDAKIFGATAIPTGTYQVILSVSPKFRYRVWAKPYGGLVPEILNVRGFTGVRIHPGTTAADTDGCPLIGRNTVVGKLTQSQATYMELMEKYLLPAWNAHEEIWLTIK